MFKAGVEVVGISEIMDGGPEGGIAEVPAGQFFSGLIIGGKCT